MVDIKIQVKGLNELNGKLKQFMPQIEAELKKAWAYIATKIVLADRGGGHPTYPPETAANRPPTPYYIRHVGTQVSRSLNLHNSQQLSDHYYFEAQPKYVKIGNRGVSYNQYVIGNPPAAHMLRLGWMSLYKIALSKRKQITAIINAVFEKVIRKLNLK